MPDGVGRKLRTLQVLFTALLVSMNLLGSKVTVIAGMSFSVAVFMVPITFVITDAVTEVYGPRVAHDLLFAALGSLVLVLCFMLVFLALPSDPRYPYAEAYRQVFGGSVRITLGSIIGFGLAQWHDIWAFEAWRRKTGGRWLWLRNNASTMVSQAIDTSVFMFVAFYRSAPQFDTSFVLGLILPYYLMKVGLAAVDTPFIYLTVRWLRR